MTTKTSRRRPATFERIGIALGLAVFVAAIAHVALVAPQGVARSSDPGAPTVSVWASVVPALIALALIRLVPPAVAAEGGPTARHPRRMRLEVLGLLACAAVFPLVMSLPAWSAADPELAGLAYIAAKVTILLAIPALALGLSARGGRGRSVHTTRPPLRWAWLPLLPVAAFIWLTQLSPFAPAPPSGWPDPVTLAVAASITALTAGVGEEVFYRYWLQTRLEALWGRGVGVLFASLVFAFMHLSSHGIGLDPVLRVTSVIAAQGTMGLVAGYLWSRYRRMWPPILLHVLTNGLLVVLHLAGLV